MESILDAPDAAPAWFEFLLDESLLEKHLNKSNGDVSATDLISLFLYQVNIAATTAREIVNKEAANGNDVAMDPTNGSVDKPPLVTVVENKKIKLLKLLAIKTACHLRWSLDIMGANLPVAIQQTLLQELMNIVSRTLCSTNHAELDISALRPEEVFAVVLYHRWCLRTVLHDCFPKKSSKAPSVQLPGLLDPSMLFANLKDGIMKSLKESVEFSQVVLESYSESGVHARMPVMSCIGSVRCDDTDSIAHNWSAGTLISATEMICQVSYDLGAVYFYMASYDKAYKAFSRCKSLLNKVDSGVLERVDEARLDGYLIACSSLLSQPSAAAAAAAAAVAATASLYVRVNSSTRNNFQGLTALLIEDLTRQELSLTFRAALEEQAQCTSRSDSLYEEVLVCNSIRKCLDGRVTSFDLVRTLNRTIGLADFVIKVCIDINRSLQEAQKVNLKLFLRNLCHTLTSNAEFVSKLLSCELEALFSVEEQSTLRSMTSISTPSVVLDTTFTFPRSGTTVDEKVRVAEMERELLVTYEIDTIKDLVQKLIETIGKVQTLFLSDQWRITRDLHVCIEGLPLREPFMAVYTHILVAKAKICLQLQRYDKATELLGAADTVIKDVSYKLSKLLRWELLRVELSRYEDTGTLDSSVQDLARKCRTCINSMALEQDPQPSAEVLSSAVALLLDAADWDFLTTLTNPTTNGYLHFAQIISLLCKELPMLRTARAPGRDFIEGVQLTFSCTVQHKRGAGGSMNVVQRDNNTAILSHDALASLISKLKEPTILSVFISCLTKLFNLVRADISEEISSDYITLWPTALSSSKLNEAAVSDMVNIVMQRAMVVNPRNVSWLRTQADLHYVQGQFWLALKYYLHVGVVSTNYFSDPITKNVYDDMVYRRMIRCCSNLNCHTQTAVLCQVFDETDYATAFKALQERTTNDSMDTYYDCIWDPTILEYLINLHSKRGEVAKRQYALQLIGQMELNSSNRPEILCEAARVRKARFFRAMARQYMGVKVPLPSR